MRKLVLGTLLVMTPFGGMRVICIDSPTDVSRSSARTEQVTDCERLCPLHQPSGTPSSTASAGRADSADSADSTENGSDCALSADASSLSIVASSTTLRPYEPLQVLLVVSAVSADSPQFYLDPALAHLGPPPKRKAL